MVSYVEQLATWLGMQPATFALTAVICSAGAYMLKRATNGSLAAFIFYPVMLLISVLLVLAANYLVQIPQDKEIVYIPAIVLFGMTIGLFVVAPMVRYMDRL